MDKRPSFFERARALASFSLVAGALGMLGCGAGPDSAAPTAGQDTPAPPQSPRPAEAEAGSVGLALEVAGAKINSASYAIVGANFQTSGTLDVSNSSRISGIVSGIPFGSDYSVTLSATSAAPEALSCDGSASFQVTSTALVSVTVPVRCRTQKATTAVATPAPLPPAATAALWLLLMGVGVGLQRRSTRLSDVKAA